MQSQYSEVAFLAPLRCHLTKPQWENLVALILAVQVARCLIGRQVSLYLIYAISSASCYRRLERVLSWTPSRWKGIQRVWVGMALRRFSPGRGPILLLIDWTLHRDRCRSLWIMLPVGGRAVPLAFWVCGTTFGGAGKQRAFEDDALRELKAWLPKGRRAVLVGDRGFRGVERMEAWKAMGYSFVVRITADTKMETETGWQPLRDLAPPPGGRWDRKGAQLSKLHPVVVQVTAVRQALPAPRRVRTNRGRLTEETRTETVWFPASDLPLSNDLAAIYALRMQIEEAFRDFKALLGLERERTRCPQERLEGWMTALMIGWTLGMEAMGVQAPQRLPKRRRGGGADQEKSDPQESRASGLYPSESRVREGLHEVWVRVLQGNLFGEELRSMWRKSERMKARPQVMSRRRDEPALRKRGKSPAEPPSGNSAGHSYV